MKRKTTMQLPCKMTEAEFRRMGEIVASLMQEKSETEDERAETMREYRDKIAALNGQIADYMEPLATGMETREIECEIRYNEPEKGLKTTYRLDTMEKVKTEDMDLADGMEDEEDEEEKALTEEVQTLSILPFSKNAKERKNA